MMIDDADEPTLDEIAERLEDLEIEHEVLGARHDLLKSFLMAVIARLAKDEDREFFRSMIETKIRLYGHTSLLDIVNDHQDLLAAFNAEMPKPETAPTKPVTDE